MISTARRNEYLEAMGIDIWVPLQSFGSATDSDVIEREAPVTCEALGLLQRIAIGPGTGSLMLLCANSQEASTPLAADIARCLDCEPVWSWPSPAGSGGAVSLEQAIAERLFTRVLVFGKALHVPASNPALPVVGTARLLQVASLPELAQKAAARRALWDQLSANNWSGPRRP